MIYRPEHAENISYVYVVNEIYGGVSDLFEKKIPGVHLLCYIFLFVT